MSDLPFHIRDFKDGDMDFISSSWLNSFREDVWPKLMGADTYYEGHQPWVKDALSRSAVLVACDKSDPNVVYGFVCAEEVAGVQIVHYAFVKKVFRGMGVGKHLFLALKFEPDKPLEYTHSHHCMRRTRKHVVRRLKSLPESDTLKEFDMKFNPYWLFRK